MKPKYLTLMSSEVEQANNQNQQKKRKLKKLFNLIQTVVEADYAFLSTDLNLIQLSQKIGTNTKYVSEAIFQETGKSFSIYVNDIRSKYALSLIKEKVDSEEEFTILSIALTCGFRSKSTFYREFNRFFGESPYAYIKKLE